LPEDIQQFLEEEKLSTGHARALLSVDDPDIQRKVAKSVIDQGLSVRETERAMRRVIEGTAPTTAVQPETKPADPNIKAAENKLRRKLGTQVRVMPSAKGTGGKVEIEYYNDGDLDKIYRLLMS